MSIPELPAELWHRICFFCGNKKELASLRLTSRFIGQVADEWILRGLPIWFAKDDFDHVDQLIRNSRIANSIRSVHFQADRLPMLHDYRSWDTHRKRQIKGEVGEEPSDFEMGELIDLMRTARGRRSIGRDRKKQEWLECNKFDKKTLRAAYVHFRNLVTEQCDLLATSRMQACMRNLFETCPKLDSILLAMRDDNSRLVWTGCKTFRDGMVEPFGDSVSTRVGVRPLNEILLAAVAAGKVIRNLDVAPISYQFFDQDEDTMSKIYGVTRKLERIAMVINKRVRYDLPDDFWDDDNYVYETRADAEFRVIDAFRDGRLARFLNEATSLRDLAITAPKTMSIMDETLRLEDIVGQTKWQHLTNLDICYFRCRSPQELGDLVLRHGENLKVLVLGDVFFVNGTWREFFQTIAGRLANLQEANFFGRFVDFSTRLSLSYHDYCRDGSRDPCHRCQFAMTLERYVIAGGELPVPGRDMYDSQLEQNSWMRDDSDSDDSDDGF